MDLDASLDAPCPPSELFAWVDDLGRYPQWLSIVTRAEPDGDGAWLVELRGRFGPLARSKRLRMVRTAYEAPHEVRFERREHDGRRHSAWVMRASVVADDATSMLTMHLHYGGGLAGPVVERLLAEEIERSAPRLAALVTA